jgi:hypothetical protein
MPARARPEPGRLPFTSLRITLVVARVNLQTLALSISLRTLDFDFDALLLVMSQCQLIGQPARDRSQPVSKGPFPFPLATEFWGSWNDSRPKTSSFTHGVDVTRGNSGFEPL